MCGIAGVVGLTEAGGTVSAMCRAIRHRGPDGGGVVERHDVTLGMTRLAIVDIAHGHQPMLSDDDAVALVYNGEIYNAPELRAGLEKDGVRFKTRSDTEVILRLYERNPDDVERHLAGMWAFAIHDRRRGRVVLSRDRFGIKPLFVADTGRALAFASELGCFTPVRTREGFAPLFRPSPAAAHALLSWGYVPELETIYEGVARLQPGTRLEVDLTSGKRTTKTYWTLHPSPDAARVRSLEEACEHIEPLLRRAAKEHLESDVPIAAFLSGGIDSSLVCAHAKDASDRPIQAFSIGFRDPRFDESPHAREVAARLGLALRVEYLDETTLKNNLADALLAYDEPFGDSSSLATFALSRVVAADHKVALSGDGGDEVFAGYKKHRIVAMRGALGRVPFLREGLAAALNALPVRTDRSRGWTDALRLARRAGRGLNGTDALAYASLTQVAPLGRTAALVPASNRAERMLERAVARFDTIGGTQLARTLTSDLANVLPNDMLTKVDRASMACHLEVRVPLLDHRIVEAGVGLPQRFTLGARGGGKLVLRELFRRRMGERLAKRGKQGFSVPVERWLGQSLAPACDALFDAKRLDTFGLLSSAELGGGRWRNWLATDPQILWHAFALAAWTEATLGHGPDALRRALVGAPPPSTTRYAAPEAP
jgi:asparagine synthase (glutamine-hydrolysing)